MVEKAWTTSEAELLAIRMLDWVSLRDGHPELPRPIDFLEDPDHLDDETRRQLGAVVDDLMDAGLVTGHFSYGGKEYYSLSLTSAGRQLVATRRNGRGSRSARGVAARDALLDWMYENTIDATGESPELESFAGDPRAHVYGDPLSDAEISRAGAVLKEGGYISGIESFGGGLSRSALTLKGQKAVEDDTYTSERSVGAGGTFNTVNIGGDNNGNAAAGQHITQRSESADAGELLALIAAVRDAATKDTDLVQIKAGAYLELLEEAAREDEPDKGVLASTARKLKEVAEIEATGAMRTTVRALWMYLADQLGLQP